MIDSCQAHLPVQYALNTELIRQKWKWWRDCLRATPESHVQNKPILFAPLALAVSLFHFTLWLNRNYDYILNTKKTVLIPN